ncbi:probable F420-dependent oxidoreductase, Rv2161c family [Trujillonella endophytica]|uniref:Probable F420-dependent oxidoreductase, Rv2161c family n=1 Tax=Trujillonella endophytica TaxID=673521 RepID=A0A1H8RTL7_9ACTN|nr:probable F420-dependent oxidoreductase, Rv2161c family [Trujillella endophytica]
MSGARSPLVGLLYRETAAAMPLLEFAQAAAERGFDSVAIGEHTHIPVSRESPFPGGGDLPDAYPEFPDPYVALAFIAAQTSLRIAVTIALVAQHDPIALAKTTATLDRMSGGRLTLGVGFGWNREELANHGKSFADRREIVRDYIRLMRTMWTETEAEYHGTHANLERSWSWPKPIQSPVPVLLGAQAGPRAFEAIIDWADGWIPGGHDLDWLATQLEELRSRWVDAGRDEAGPVVWPMQNFVLTDEQLQSRLERLRELSVHQVLLDIPTAGRDEVLPLLDRYANVLAASR